MSNNTPLTPSILTEHIRCAIPGLIGSYTRKDNAVVTEAISVGNPPNNVKVDGVEVIIGLYPTVPKSCEGGGAIHSVEHWEVCLVNHGNDKGTYFNAIRGMHDYFPRKKGQDVPQNSITESLPMYYFTIIYGRGYDRALNALGA